MAIISLREIKSGEFFCVLKSDSEESEEGESEENAAVHALSGRET